MARMLHQRGAPRGQGRQKVFIAVAAYAGCGAGFTYALFHTGAALAEAGIEHELAIYSGNCHVDSSRNRLVRDFLNSDCTDLVFLDVDVGWVAADFIKLLRHDRDVVAGVYPKKHGDDTYPVMTLPGEIWSDADGLIEVAGVPTGFLRIRRSVLERLSDGAQTYNARNERAMATALIFERQVINGELWGGDYVFCRKWRAIGGKIYIDPDMRFEHSGEETWVGQVGMYFRQRAGIGLVAGLDAIKAGKETPESLSDLRDAWDNPFSAGVGLLLALAMTARAVDGPILECGSGLSSLVLAAANPNVEVHTLEDSPVFAAQVQAEAEKHGLTNLHIHCLPHRDGWYDLTSLPAHDWALVFIDGPRRAIGGRAEAPERIDISRATVIADDVQDDGGVPELLAALETSHAMQVFESGKRSFALGAPRKSRTARAA